MSVETSISTSAILTYHSLDDSGSVISIGPELFRRQLEFLAGSAIPVVPLAEVRSRQGAVALTFDDGFRNFHEQALPVLTKYRMPAAVFVVSGHVGRRNDWPSQRPSQVPLLELMDWNEVTEIARAGITLGAHTVTHPNLKALPAERVAQELDQCRSAIEDRVGAPVESFAYPYGTSNPAVRRLAAQRFVLACGTHLRFLDPAADPHDLPRIDAFYLRRLSRFQQLFSRQGVRYIARRRFLRDLKAGLAIG